MYDVMKTPERPKKNGNGDIDPVRISLRTRFDYRRFLFYERIVSLFHLCRREKDGWFSLRPRAGIACASMENAKKIRDRILTIIFYWKNRASWTPRLWILSPTYRPYVLAHRVWEGITRTCPSVFPRLRRLKGAFKIACLTLWFREHIRNDSISPSFDFVWQ